MEGSAAPEEEAQAGHSFLTNSNVIRLG